MCSGARHRGRNQSGQGKRQRDRPGDSGPQRRLRALCSIVIPTYNGRGLLELCLASIARHRPADGGPSIEVIVADDASTDHTAEWVSQVHPDVRLVRMRQNGGFCAAANAGIALARGRYIQVLNNDTEVTPGWIETGLAPFVDETVGSVAPWCSYARSQAGSTRRATRMPWPAGRPSAGTASPRSCSRRARRRRFRRQRLECVLSG